MKKNKLVSIDTQNRKRQLRREIVISVAVAVMVTMGTNTVFGAGGKVDISQITSNLETILVAIISLVGAAIAIFGVFHLIEAHANPDPQAKSHGAKQLAVGLGTILAGTILIPVLMDSVDFGSTTTTTTETT
jgi:hypothetical protein